MQPNFGLEIINLQYTNNMNEFAQLSPMTQALTLMLVGMGTVFVVLILVIYLSQFMITIVNKVAPEAEAKPVKLAASAAAAVEPGVEAAIRQAIAQVVPGATVTKIVKK